MAKRTTLSEPGGNPKDFWATPPDAVLPLLEHLPDGSTFIEPCAGDGALRDTLQARGHRCTIAGDLQPRGPGIKERDALTVTSQSTYCITNPPYSEALVKPLLRHWIKQPQITWLLIPTDWLANLWFGEFAPNVERIVPVGRVKWIADSPSSGFENSAWFKFTKHQHEFLVARERKATLQRRDRQRAEAALLS